MKIKCPHCGVENLGDAVYCVVCNNKLPLMPEEPSVKETVTDRTSWEKRNEIGFFAGFWLTAKELLFHPGRFFSKMPTTGGLGGPLLFGIIAAFLSDGIKLGCFIIMAIFPFEKLNPYGFLVSNPRLLLYSLAFIPLIAILKIFICAFLLNICLWVAGARKGFQATFRVVAYSEAINLFVIFWIPIVLLALILSKTLSTRPLLPFVITLFSIAIITIVIWLIEVVLYGIGSKYAHNIGKIRATFGILIYIVLLLAISYATSKIQPKSRICPLPRKSLVEEKEQRERLGIPGKIKGKFKVDGILYSKDNPSVMINSQVCRINDAIAGGKIISIAPDRVVIKFGDKVEAYTIGSEIWERE